MSGQKPLTIGLMSLNWMNKYHMGDYVPTRPSVTRPMVPGMQHSSDNRRHTGVLVLRGSEPSDHWKARSVLLKAKISQPADAKSNGL